MLTPSSPQKINFVSPELLQSFDWKWFQVLLQKALPFFTANDEYVTLSNFLNAEKYMYSRSKLVEELKTLSEEDFSRNYPCSFRLTNVQRLSPDIAKICHEFGKKFNKVSTCNLYFTPGLDKNCFDYHSDIQEILILHLKGIKEWKFPLDESGKFICHVKDMTFDKKHLTSGGEENILLQPGDQLLVPYAMAHGVQIKSEGPAIHLTFSTYEKQVRNVTDNVFREILNAMNLQDRQFDKLELDEVRAIVGQFKKMAFSLNADTLTTKIQNEMFKDDIKTAKLGRSFASHST